MSFLRFFISIVCGALSSSVIGGIFACMVAFVSPEFVSSLFGREVSGSLVRYAAGVGMIWGYFSVPAMAFSLGMTDDVQLARICRRDFEGAALSAP
jgi:hypothetical protein